MSWRVIDERGRTDDPPSEREIFPTLMDLAEICGCPTRTLSKVYRQAIQSPDGDGMTAVFDGVVFCKEEDYDAAKDEYFSRKDREAADEGGVPPE